MYQLCPRRGPWVALDVGKVWEYILGCLGGNRDALPSSADVAVYPRRTLLKPGHSGPNLGGGAVDITISHLKNLGTNEFGYLNTRMWTLKVFDFSYPAVTRSREDSFLCRELKCKMLFTNQFPTLPNLRGSVHVRHWYRWFQLCSKIENHVGSRLKHIYIYISCGFLGPVTWRAFLQPFQRDWRK